VVSKSKKKRYSLSLRFQPYEGDLMAEVVQYLNSLPNDEVIHKVADALITTLLPYARYAAGSFTAEQVRLACFEAQNSLDKQGRNMRLALGVEQLQAHSPHYVVPISSSPVVVPNIQEREPEGLTTKLPTPTDSDITPEDLNSLFE
jgi:hypothetical protein